MKGSHICSSAGPQSAAILFFQRNFDVSPDVVQIRFVVLHPWRGNMVRFKEEPCWSARHTVVPGSFESKV